MKKLIILFSLFFSLFFSVFGFAQDSTQVKIETPKIVSQLQLGRSAVFKDVGIEFVKLVSDSRCPKGVSCIWAGEVVILVDVVVNGSKSERKKMTFNELNVANDIYVSEDLTISGVNITPYPIHGEKIKLEDYKIQLYVKH